jgi:thiamine-monophosphate kinase
VTLKELGEFGFINRIAARAGSGCGVALGIGDDAAAVIPTPGLQTLVTTDMLAEGVHFDRVFTTPFALGCKSLAVNLSDMAAMGGIPRFALLSLAIPPDLPLDFLDPFMAGFALRGKEQGVSLIGGDTCSSRSGFTISVTLMGEQHPGRIIRRSGARPGDLIHVTGTVGDSALGLELLRRGERGGAAIARHLDPLPRNGAGVALAETGMATAMIDVSDGLLADLGHILEQSGGGATLFLQQLPLSPEYLRRIPQFDDDLFGRALSGGEDYELLFTAPPGREQEIRELSGSLGLPMTVIGEIRSDPGLVVISPDGTTHTPRSRGFDHFA